MNKADAFNEVSEADFEKYWQDPRLQKIVRYFANRFFWIKRPRQIQAARLALWQTLRRYIPNHARKANIYTFFRSQCNGYFLKEVTDKIESGKPKQESEQTKFLANNVRDRKQEFRLEALDYLLSLPNESRILIEGRFLYNLTDEELAAKHNMSVPEINRKIHNIITFLRTGELL